MLHCLNKLCSYYFVFLVVSGPHTFVASLLEIISNKLRNKYKKTRFNPEGAQWPPHQPKLIVSVALIHYKGNRTQQELFEIANIHKEGFDKFYSSTYQESSTKKQRLDYSRVTKNITDIFAADPSDITENGTSSTNTPKRTLIEGAPGIGKTVLAKEIAYSWATTQILTEIKIVFLLYLRDPHLQIIETTKQLVEYMSMGCLDDEQITTLNKHLMNTEGQQLCVVMDGFDEYPTSSQNNSFIVDIISRKILTEAIVVITSRPTATVSLHDRVDRRIDILGLPKEERDKYISQVFSYSPEKELELTKYLKQQPVINGLCFVPLHLAILLYLFQQGSLPETLTEMNESFILHTIYRHLDRDGVAPSGLLDRLKDVPKQVLDIVYKLSELAFKGLQENKLVFTFDEIKQTCPNIDETVGAINGFGLLQAVEHYPHKGVGKTTSFNFLHYTMQEFLAALHVSTLPSEQQSSLMEKTFWDGHYNFMWMMFVGIVGVKSDVFVNFISKGKVYIRKSGVRIADNIRSNKRKCLHVFQCYLEAKENTEMPEVISSMFKDGKVAFSKVKLLPHNITSLMSFICTKQSIQWKSLELQQCKIGDTGMSVLQQFISDTTSTLEHVDFSKNYSSPWGVYCAIIRHCSVNSLTLCGDDGIGQYVNELKEVLQMNTTLISMKLSNINNNGAVNIAKAIQMNTTLQTLDMSSNEISDDGVIAISDYLKRNSSLEKINLSKNRITNEGAKMIAEALQLNTTLKQLDLSINKMFDDGTTAISNVLITNKSLQELNISKNEITNEGAKMIAEALQLNTTLKQLDLSINKILDDGTTAIFNVLITNKSLQKLNISKNRITNEGAKMIAEALQLNTTLKQLDLSINKILDDGTTAIFNVLITNKSLQELNISKNGITNEGAKMIGKALQLNTTLKQLDLSINKIFDDGVTAISNVLKSNITLQELNISHNNITNKGITKITEAIQINSTLQNINISKNHITTEGLLYFMETVKNTNSLQVVNITHNNVTRSEFANIKQCVENLQCSIQIFASWNEIDKNGKLMSKISKSCSTDDIKEDIWSFQEYDPDHLVMCLSECLKEDDTLQELDFRNKEVTREGAKLISQAIKVNKTLKNLNIYGNLISDDGAAAISDALKSNNSLQELYMGKNNITDEGAKQIAEAIKVNTNLKILSITSNAISDDGAAAISDSLKSNNLLQKLYMYDNNITSEGAKKVAEAIKVNTTLKILTINGNTISDDGVAAISDSLKSNNSLQELYMSNSNSTSEEAKEIAEAIKVNTTLHTLDIIDFFNNDRLSFNMTVLTAVHHNNTLMKLWLPYVSGDDDGLVRSEVEKINMERTRQGISTLTCHYWP